MSNYKYLENKELDIAINEYLSIVKENIEIQKEIVKAKESIGRITAKPVYAKISSPNSLVSAVDGIATCYEKTAFATPTTPVYLEEGKDFIYVDTGDKIPENYNSVIMIEDLIYDFFDDKKKIKIINGATLYSNIRQIGEDISEQELIVPINTYITPEIASLFLQTLNFEIEVYKKPVVTIIPTGDEIIEAEYFSEINNKTAINNFFKTDDKAFYIESNSTIFKGYLEEWGCKVNVFPVVKDNFEKLIEKFKEALNISDIVLINAGSSAGRDDLTSKVIEYYGKVITHGIAIKPGKPTILGISKNKPVIGIPGYPVSGIIVMKKIVKEIVKLFTKKDIEEEKLIYPDKIEGIITKKINSSLKTCDFVRVSIGKVKSIEKKESILQESLLNKSILKEDKENIEKENILKKNKEDIERKNILKEDKKNSDKKKSLKEDFENIFKDDLEDIFTRNESNYVINPLNSGSGVLSSWIKANGLLKIDQNVEGILQGTKVYIQPLKNKKYIDNTILIAGSHDPIIDDINNLIQEKYWNRYITISISNAGSIAGINIIKNNGCHISPIHILDENDGTYNKNVFSNYKLDQSFKLIKGVKRVQGIIVKKGNPLDIKSVGDIKEKKAKYVNRQSGSGTRILFDYLLKKNNISKNEICDYERIEFTHNQVALQIAKANGDCGLGIEAVTRIYNLDFIPVAEEEYDFVVPEYFLKDKKFEIFCEILYSNELQKRMKEKYGGYIFYI